MLSKPHGIRSVQFYIKDNHSDSTETYYFCLKNSLIMDQFLPQICNSLYHTKYLNEPKKKKRRVHTVHLFLYALTVNRKSEIYFWLNT